MSYELVVGVVRDKRRACELTLLPSYLAIHVPTALHRRSLALARSHLKPYTLTYTLIPCPGKLS